MLDELLDETRLSGWEMDYVESLDEQREDSLSDQQVDRLVEIHGKYCE